MDNAFELMKEFYLSSYFDPNAKRNADVVQAAIQWMLDNENPDLSHSGGSYRTYE